MADGTEGQTDRHTDIQCETKIPRHYCVVGYKKKKKTKYKLINVKIPWFFLVLWELIDWLIVFGFNNTSTFVGHFVLSPREREKKDRRDSRKDEREGQGS